MTIDDFLKRLGVNAPMLILEPIRHDLEQVVASEKATETRRCATRIKATHGKALADDLLVTGGLEPEE